MKRRDITAPFSHEYLKSILRYNPTTGKWIWLINKPRIRVGLKAGGFYGKYGYRVIGINRKYYYTTILAWFYMTGEWPPIEVDHINRNKLDERWENLRLATHSQNGTNRIWPPKKSGLPRGVGKSGRSFQARLRTHGKLIHLGYYSTPEEAHQAYLKASEFRKEFLPK